MAEGAQVPIPGPEGGGMSGSQMQANLTSAKESRKRAELDAQLLANRIALLKQEEEKAWKKIEETRKRANEITELRNQNEQKFAAKEQIYKAKWESIRAAQTQNAYNRDKARAVRDATKQGLMDQRCTNANKAKQQSHQFLLQKKERESAERQANLERGNLIKQKKEEAKRRLEEDRLAQLEKYREDYEARTAQEELLRARTDALVAKMEKEEMELIQRLQNTQTVQRNAYEELEAALGQTAQQISSSSNPYARPGVPANKGGQPQPAA
mmetsp:Transcript_31348/g.86171  ORF Transcript_31348/g.86171 Transcript_31348/m.86171 type:complete len:269 (-) Transcript_31348:190-996(-)